MKKPKAPAQPFKPFKPAKPIAPKKMILSEVIIKSIDIDDYTAYSVEEFVSSFKNDNELKDKKFRFKTRSSFEYDDCMCSISIEFFMEAEIEDPNYKFYNSIFNKKLKKYPEELEKYNKDLLIYNDQMKDYKIKFSFFKEEYSKYELEKVKEKVKKLESKIKNDQ